MKLRDFWLTARFIKNKVNVTQVRSVFFIAHAESVIYDFIRLGAQSSFTEYTRVRNTTPRVSHWTYLRIENTVKYRKHNYLSLCGIKLFSFGCSSSDTVASIISNNIACNPFQSLEEKY